MKSKFLPGVAVRRAGTKRLKAPLYTILRYEGEGFYVVYSVATDRNLVVHEDDMDLAGHNIGGVEDAT